MIRKATLLLFVLCCCIPVVLLAQPGGGGPATPPDVPITGIELLIAAGGALGLRAFLAKKDKSKE